MASPTPVNVGLRVKFARTAMSMSQEELSKAVGFNDRQTLSDIENGKRDVKAEELLKFSETLDRDVEFFLDPFSVVGEAKYSWRARRGVPEAVLSEFEAKAAGWVGMLRWLRTHSPIEHSPLGFTLRLDIGSSFEQAQLSAEQLVKKFELGPVPASKLIEFVEQSLDIPVLFVDMDNGSEAGAIAGAACHLPELGVVLVNRRESQVRRNFDLAHEVFHCLTWERMEPEHLEFNSDEQRKRIPRVEKLADNFASALLMPRESLDVFLDSRGLKDIGHLVEVADKLCVSVDALGWRLRALGRIDEATRERLAQVPRKNSTGDMPRLFSERFVKELHVSLDKGRITARKAAKTLGLTLQELSQLFKELDLTDPVRS